MPNTIRVKRSAVAGKVPLTTDLQLGEIAINTYDGKVYTKRNNGSDALVQIGAYTVSSTAPTAPVDGDRWFDLGTGITYTYTNDGTSSQWVETGAPGIGPQGIQGAASDVTLAGANAFTGANTFTNSTGQLFRQAATQDAVLLRGRAGGTTSLNVELVPTTLTASRTLTLPDVSGTVITTGDTDTVTATMIAPTTITNTEIATNAAIAGTKIAPDFGAQLIQSSQANQAFSLTGSLNPSTTSNGLLSVGTLGFSGSRMGANFTSSQTSYYQVVLQNTSSNAGASTDFVVCNDVSTDSATYGNFGINSSTFTGSGALSAPSATYVTSTTGPLVLGSTTAHDLRFVYNSETTDALTISANDATFGKTLKPRAGTTTAAPLDFTAGTNLTTPIAGAVEYDGTCFFGTATTTSGRGQIPVLQTFRLAANGSAIGGTIADYFGATSAINLAASSGYDIEMLAYLQKTTAGTLTWTLTASSAPTLITGMFWAGPVTGIAAGTPTTLYTGSRGATTAAFGATGSVSNNAFMAYQFKVQVITNLATTFKLQITCGAGTVTPQAGSFYTVRQICSTTGSFA